MSSGLHDGEARVEGRDIDLSSDVADFFRDVVASTVQHHHFDATCGAQTYIVELLADYARPDRLSDETLSRPLTLLLDEALHKSGSERFARLRALGDGVLYVTGFFGDHLETRGVELGYVSSLGARAYDAVSAMIRRAQLSSLSIRKHRSTSSESAVNDVFRELADNFAMFVELLSHVADDIFANSVRSDGAVLKLYERWLRTRSSSLAAVLVTRGVVPQRGDGTLH